MATREHRGAPPTTAVTQLPSGGRARFLLATVDGGVQLYTLPASGTIVLGRAPDCDVVLDHASISRRHAELELAPTSRVTDLESRNGTLFRGERLPARTPTTLAVGESFTLGSVSIVLLPPGATPSIAAVSGSRLRVEDPTADDASGLLTGVAQSSASVLILGETGVGKEVLSARLHRLSGRTGRFVAINCAALSETLLESELFGHEKGAFTGATHTKEGLLRSAAGGTLFLDEIGEMSPAVQAKVLRAIETQSIMRLGGVQAMPIDVRFLAATHRDLLAATKDNSFRRDLYYRLAGFSLFIPPLRERRAQIVRIATELLASSGRSSSLSPAAAVALTDHDWPGNVRELRNVLQRAAVLAQGHEIDVPHLVFDTAAAQAAPAAPPDERARIVAALDACAGNQSRAAKLLGISRTTLIQKIRLLAIPRPRTR